MKFSNSALILVYSVLLQAVLGLKSSGLACFEEILSSGDMVPFPKNYSV